MVQKIVKAGLFFLLTLLISSPAWSATPADINPDAALTAETGSAFILACNVTQTKNANKGDDGYDNARRWVLDMPCTPQQRNVRPVF